MSPRKGAQRGGREGPRPHGRGRGVGNGAAYAHPEVSGTEGTVAKFVQVQWGSPPPFRRIPRLTPINAEGTAPVTHDMTSPLRPLGLSLRATSLTLGSRLASPSSVVLSSLASRSTTRWVNPAKDYDRHKRHTTAEEDSRPLSLPYTVEQYVGWSARYFDALRFQEVWQAGISLPNRYRRSWEEAWTACWRHLPLVPSDQTRTQGRSDLCHFQCWPEMEYQIRPQTILSDLQHLPRPEDVPPSGSFLPTGHSALGLPALEPPFDRLYWLWDRC